MNRQEQIGLYRLMQLAGLNQGVRYDANKQRYQFDFKNDKPDDIVTLKYRPSVFQKQFTGGRRSAGQMISPILHTAKMSGLTVFYAYKSNKRVPRQRIDAFLKFIKYDWIQQREDYEAMVNKAVIGFQSAIGAEGLDLIITPHSSSSVPNDIAQKIKQRSPNAVLQTQAIVKRSLDDIKIDIDKYLRSAKDEADKRKRMSNIKSDYKRATRTGQFKIKKTAGMRRNLYSNFMKFKDDAHRKMFNRIMGGNVLIVDDVVTSGSTVKQMVNQVAQFAPKNVYVFVLIKGS